MSIITKNTKKFHNKHIYFRRMHRLTQLLAPLLKNSNNILDVGCGDGRIDSYLLAGNKDIQIQGIDVLLRSETYIDVKQYDGKHIPFPDGKFDTVMVIDVLHHTDNPGAVLGEISRVSSRYVVIKDHIRANIISYFKLRIMDYVGNAHYNVELPYNYLTIRDWKKVFQDNNLKVLKSERHLDLYKGIFHVLFDSNLHFIALLEKQ